jgi:hypothetical protein
MPKTVIDLANIRRPCKTEQCKLYKLDQNLCLKDENPCTVTKKGFCRTKQNTRKQQSLSSGVAVQSNKKLRALAKLKTTFKPNRVEKKKRTKATHPVEPKGNKKTRALQKVKQMQFIPSSSSARSNNSDDYFKDSFLSSNDANGDDLFLARKKLLEMKIKGEEIKLENLKKEKKYKTRKDEIKAADEQEDRFKENLRKFKAELESLNNLVDHWESDNVGNIRLNSRERLKAIRKYDAELDKRVQDHAIEEAKANGKIGNRINGDGPGPGVEETAPKHLFKENRQVYIPGKTSKELEATQVTTMKNGKKRIVLK